MKEYLGYDTIPVYNFYKISESNDFRWFYKKYDGHNIEELKDEALLLLAERFKQIFLDRIEYLDDVKTKEYYRKLIEVNNLEMKCYRLQNTFNTIKDIPFENEYFFKFVDDLKEEGLKFGKIVIESQHEAYLKLMESKIKGWNTKLKALKIEYKDILNPEKSKHTFDLVKEKIILKEVLPEQDINTKITVLKEWDALVKRAGEKAKEHKAQMAKIKR